VTSRREARLPVAIVGPTAAGKSALAVAAAIEHGHCELVSVDAMQVYRGMDIGTAKPSAAERAAVAHHCLDLVDPASTFTLADYRVAAREALQTIAGRGNRAVLVGGTGLYVRSIIDGLEPPGQWPEVRATLEAEADTAALHARLTELDPAAAAKITPQNRRRIIRALEVGIGSGRPFSTYGPGLDSYPPSDTVQIGLRIDRGVLGRRIEARVQQMMEAGLLDEVRCLAGTAGGLSPTARQALGYKELLDHLAGRVSLDEAVATTMARTRRYAARQERWFRRDPRVRWVEVDDDPLKALPAVLEALA
jgi:tRNA dimethylallyltransferase